MTAWYDDPTIADERDDDEAGTADPHQARTGRAAAGGKKSQATTLMELAEDAGAEYFHDDEQAYLSVPVDEHRETYVLRSRSGRAWLQNLYIDARQTCAGAQAIADASNALEALALRGPAHRVHVRIATTADAIYLDVGEGAWRVVKITAAGWQIISDAPVRFRRPKGLLPLPMPRRGGSITALRPFVNAPHDDMFMLLVADILAIMRGRGPYPILALFGEQGTAKSTTTKVIKQLVDPSTAPLRSEPREPRDLMIAAANGHILAFDNISSIKPWLSDCLCRLATGGGFSTRTLYENREEEIFDAVRPVILNGIPEFVTRPDLVSRSLFQYPPPIPDHGRRDERVFWPAFDREHPSILGALCDIVATALQREAGVDLPTKPRMADFATWIVAAEPACPWTAGQFLPVYTGNRQQAAEAVLEGEPVADVVKALVAKSPETLATWTGTATALFEELKRVTPDASQRQKDWYRSPRHVSDDLRRLAPALRHVGIDVRFTKAGHDRTRLIELEQLCESSSASSAEPSGVGDSGGRSADADPGDPSASSAGASADSHNVHGAADAADAADELLPRRSNGESGVCCKGGPLQPWCKLCWQSPNYWQVR